ncbi:MAG: hypothetical protein K0S27_1118 [Gammaproteobacteria bacterium]|jgi:hypothetical protein|nr:hypothetical protein [Gammaproteobacteria bacterium]
MYSRNLLREDIISDRILLARNTLKENPWMINRCDRTVVQGTPLIYALIQLKILATSNNNSHKEDIIEAKYQRLFTFIQELIPLSKMMTRDAYGIALREHAGYAYRYLEIYYHTCQKNERVERFTSIA